MRVGIWSALAAAVFAAVLAAAPSVLKAAHVHWAAWPVALCGAVVTALAGLARPVTGAVTQRWADRTRSGLEQRDRARDLEHEVSGRDKGLPLAGEITDRALLGIHPSIPLPPGADPSLAADLPLYIPRDVDGDLRTWVTAHREPGGFLLLVGPAAAGKTRCAYELVHDMLADWPMFMPSTSAQLADYFGASPVRGKLVVWLNETQKFLGPGGLTTATVRSILARPHPVIIVGTIWPRHYDSLTGATTTALGNGGEDAREILTMLAQRKDLGPEFSRAERDRATSIAVRDPRIAEANEAPAHRLAETLAAAPDLVSRWLTASDPHGAAVITAAVTARRCGHPDPLPATVLEPLAAAVMTPADLSRATTAWFTNALSWARVPVRGTAAPLTPYSSTPGVIDGDQVSDVLVQHAIRHPSVPGHTIPEAEWLLHIEHASPEACRQIADVAYRQRNTHRALVTELAVRKAAGAGQADAMEDLGFLLNERGEKAEAEQWYRKAAEAGLADAMVNLGVLLNERGEKAEAEQWYRKAAEAGLTRVMSRPEITTDWASPLPEITTHWNG